MKAIAQLFVVLLFFGNTVSANFVDRVMTYKNNAFGHAFSQLSPRDLRVMQNKLQRDVPHAPVCPDDSGDRRKDFTRETVAYCFHYLADTDCDHAISAAELNAGRQNHLSYFERAVVFLGTSTHRIMQACDKNGDGKISHTEFVDQWQGCLDTQSMMCHARDVCFREIPKSGPICKN